MMICCWTCDQMSGYELSFNNPEMNLMKNEFGRKTKICWARIHCKCLYKRMSIILIVLNKTIRCITCINNEITFHYLSYHILFMFLTSFIHYHQSTGEDKRAEDNWRRKYSSFMSDDRILLMYSYWNVFWMWCFGSWMLY